MYEEYEVTFHESSLTGDALEEGWFRKGEELKDDYIDWVDWVDLYQNKIERWDLIVHWVRCLFNPALPRPCFDR